MDTSEEYLAKRIANQAVSNDFEAAAVVIAGAKEKNPSRSLFHAGAYTGAHAATALLNREIERGAAVLTELSSLLESTLDSAIVEIPDSPLTDKILQARNSLASYSQAAWGRFWEANEEHFASGCGVKRHVFVSETEMDYCAMAERLLEAGERLEAHPFFAWYIGEEEQSANPAVLAVLINAMTDEQLDHALQCFRDEPNQSYVVALFIKAVRAAWVEVRADIAKEASGHALPSLDMTARINSLLQEKYGQPQRVEDYGSST